MFVFKAFCLYEGMDGFIKKIKTFYNFFFIAFLMISMLGYIQNIFTALPFEPANMIYFPVSKICPLPVGYEPPDLVELKNLPISVREDLKVRAIIVRDLVQLIEDAAKEGIYMKVVSGYRSFQRQEEVRAYWKKREIEKGLSEIEAEEKINTFCAQPGYSEHQLGTAVDIVSLKSPVFEHNDENNQIWQWIAENKEKYGFVLSYPEKEIYLTGYIYEPWHIRWVGKEHAAMFKNLKHKEEQIITTTAQYLEAVYRACS